MILIDCYNDCYESIIHLYEYFIVFKIEIKIDYETI